MKLGLKKIAAMVILRHVDRFLLLKRNKAPNINMYVPVGGKLEPFEAPRAAAIRETAEETGLQIEAPRFCGTLIESSPTIYNWMSYIYIADIEDMPPPYCDEGTLEWIHIDDFLRVPTPPTDWQIYQYVLQQRPFAFCAEYDKDLNMLKMTEEIEGIVVHPSFATKKL